MYIYVYTHEVHSKSIRALATKNTVTHLGAGILIPFIVVSLGVYTLFPVVLPLLDTFLEGLLQNGVQQSHHNPRDVFLRCKSGPF